MYRLATSFWVSSRAPSPQGLSVAPHIYFLVKFQKIIVFILEVLDPTGFLEKPIW